jgi:MFS transporter, DHA2 family, multidrug resistance protein
MIREEIYRARYLIAFAVVLASMLELIDSTIVNVAIPQMMGHLGATMEEIAWVNTGYIVANVIVLPLTGWLAHRLGRRNYYTGSVLLFTVASFFSGHATSLESLVFWRIVQGMGGGALISTAQAILYDVFPTDQRGTAMAIFGVGVMVGPTLGPTIGGWITDNYSWPWIFYVNLPIGAIAAMLTWHLVPEPEHEAPQSPVVDWAGLGFLIVGVGSLQTMLERGESQDWLASREIKAYAAMTVIGLMLFVWRELRCRHPMVDLRVLVNRQLAAGTVFAFVFGSALYAGNFALPVFLQNLLNHTAWDTGLVLLPGALASALGMAVGGKLSARSDARLFIAAGSALWCWALWEHSLFTTEIGLQDTLWPIILRGAALGIIFVPLANATVADLRPDQMAQGTGLFNLMRQLGGSVGIALTSTFLSHYTAEGRQALVTHLSPERPEVREWLERVTLGALQRGGTLAEAQQRAEGLLANVVERQATMLAFERLFLLMGLTLAVGCLLLFFFRTGKTVGGGLAH